MGSERRERAIREAVDAFRPLVDNAGGYDKSNLRALVLHAHRAGSITDEKREELCRAEERARAAMQALTSPVGEPRKVECRECHTLGLGNRCVCPPEWRALDGLGEPRTEGESQCPECGHHPGSPNLGGWRICPKCDAQWHPAHGTVKPMLCELCEKADAVAHVGAMPVCGNCAPAFRSPASGDTTKGGTDAG